MRSGRPLFPANILFAMAFLVLPSAPWLSGCLGSGVSESGGRQFPDAARPGADAGSPERDAAGVVSDAAAVPPADAGSGPAVDAQDGQDATPPDTGAGTPAPDSGAACGTGEANPCGGCAPLDPAPGAACGRCGIAACDGPDAVRCDDPGPNACGGCAALPGRPGETCGDCGTWGCDGPDGLRCDDPGPTCHYPAARSFKGIQPDGAPVDDVAGNQAGRVAVNLVWAGWEPERRSPPCADGQLEFDGRCFVVQGGAEGRIRDFSARGVIVTGILYGAPPWARAARQPGCTPPSEGMAVFCAPDDPNDFARFAGMIAARYDGRHGLGRVSDFVIWNEVNHSDWFDVGTPPAGLGLRDHWLATHNALFLAAYDAILAQHGEVRVLVSLTDQFGPDQLDGGGPRLSGYTVIDALAGAAGERGWQVAIHPYSVPLGSPDFGPADSPAITFGTLGRLTGWLRQRWPDRPDHAHVLITEVGFDSSRWGPDAQRDALCSSYREALATPGVDGYIYHRYQDHPLEVAAGAALGLHTEQGDPKPSWVRWALMDRSDVAQPQLDCGFELLPYVVLHRRRNPQSGMHWATTRLAASGFAQEQPEASNSWRLSREPAAATHELFECAAGAAHHFVARDPGCEGQTAMGSLGFAWDDAGPDRVELLRCARPADRGDHLVSTHGACEGWLSEGSLGFVLRR